MISNRIFSILFLFIVIGMLGASSVYTEDSLNSISSLILHNNGTSNDNAYKTLMEGNDYKDIEEENKKKTNRNFEKMIQLLNILGQVDSFLSERTKSMMRKLALLAEDDDHYYRKRRS